MSSLNRRQMLLLPLALAACGFTPAYGPGGGAGALLDSTWLASPTDRNSFDFVERVEERLGRPQQRRYDLTYEITTETVSAGITYDQRITRYNLTGLLRYRLSRSGSDEVLVEGRTQSFTAYAATGSTVAGLAAEEDAALRLMRILADQMVSLLVAQMAARSTAASNPPAAAAATSGG